MDVAANSTATLYGAVVATRPAAGSRVCADCRYAQLYAVQPRAVCTCPGAILNGRVVPSGQPACEDARARTSADLTLAWWSPAPEPAAARFARVPPRLY